MAYIMDELDGDFQQGGCLYNLTSGIQCNGHPNTCGHLTGLRNASQVDQSTFGNGVVVIRLLMELLIDDEKHSLPLCTYVVGFCEACHILICHMLSNIYLHITVVVQDTYSGEVKGKQVSACKTRVKPILVQYLYVLY